MGGGVGSGLPLPGAAIVVVGLQPAAAAPEAPPLVKLPLIATLMSHVPLTQPTAIIAPTALITPYTLGQRAVAMADKIDLSRVVASRGKKGQTGAGKPYLQSELKEIARSLGLLGSMNKAALVAAIRAKLTGTNY